MIETLTPRERQVIELVIEAKRNKQIAYELNLSVGTVKVYVCSIFRKLGVTSRVELVRRFSKNIADI